MANSSSYGRQFEILLNDEVFIAQSAPGERQFKVLFDVLIDFSSSISYCELSIYNISKSTRDKFFKRDTKIALRAGYESTIDTIFVGTIRNSFVERDGASIVSRLVARGGSLLQVAVNQTFTKGTSVVSIIRACIEAAGYPADIEEAQFTDVPPITRGYTTTGNPRTQLYELARAYGFEYTTENERIVITRNSASRAGSPTLVNKFTGMEGIPKIGAFNSNRVVEMDVDIRLNPKLRIGTLIEVESELSTFTVGNVFFQDVPANAGTGTYKITRIRHVGDSWGNQWTSQVTSIGI